MLVNDFSLPFVLVFVFVPSPRNFFPHIFLWIAAFLVMHGDIFSRSVYSHSFFTAFGMINFASKIC